MADDTTQAIEGEVVEMLALQKQLEDAEVELSQNEQFQNFLNLQKKVTQDLAAFWKGVEERMIDNNIKSIKGDWGSLTIAERQNFKADLEKLPAKFVKRVADNTKIANYYTLEDKLPKGVERTISKFLTKRFKNNG